MPELLHHKLTTPWQVDQPIPLPEYPRPQMVRGNWQNLNGWWECAIQNLEAPKPISFTEKILVPFAPESRLSGVEHVLQPDEKLWYRRGFRVNHAADEVVMLHFGAVDFACELWINGRRVGEHWGGYLPFSFDITAFLIEGENELLLACTDATEAGLHQRGKQRLETGGIFYTSVSGIWQTVWLEVLPARHIRSLKLTPNLDAGSLLAEVVLSDAVDPSGAALEAVASFAGQEVARASAKAASQMLLHIPNPHKWHPDHPHLYDLTLRLKVDGVVVDELTSYFAMRKIGKARDDKGVSRSTMSPSFSMVRSIRATSPRGSTPPPAKRRCCSTSNTPKRSAAI